MTGALVFREVCELVCPHCRAGFPARKRIRTNEWVHDMKGASAIDHTICWASGFRNSRFADIEAGSPDQTEQKEPNTDE